MMRTLNFFFPLISKREREFKAKGWSYEGDGKGREFEAIGFDIHG